MEQRTINTPASIYLESRKRIKTFMAIHQSIKVIGYMDDMCACIAELERETGCIYSNDFAC